MSNTIDEIISNFSSLDEVKRIKELEPLIDNNEEVKQKLDELLSIQKELINSRYYKLSTREELENKYNQKKNEIIELPFLDEYLELLDFMDERLINFKSIVEKSINKDINL